MTMQVELRDAELAEHLAKTLTDFEFEMLLRKRIELAYGISTSRNSEFTTSYAMCEFNYHWDDKSEWKVRVGTSYKDAVYGEGEVLTRTYEIAVQTHSAQTGNKLSLLLPAPEPKVFE